MKSRGHHIAQHDRRSRIDALGKTRKVGIRLVDMEILGKYAVFEIGKFPARQHPARVHGIPALRL